LSQARAAVINRVRSVRSRRSLDGEAPDDPARSDEPGIERGAAAKRPSLPGGDRGAGPPVALGLPSRHDGGMSGSHSGRKRPTALVTGASAGLGRVFAERLAADGHDLVVVARDEGRLQTLAAHVGKRHRAHVEVLPADLSRRKGLRAVEERIAALPPLALLVNNAGFGTAGAFAELDVEGEEDEIRLNVLALVRLTRAALPAMLARGRGAIINVSSMAGFQPGPYSATYAATKAYVTSFTESLAEELRDTGVHVQALCPGFTRTEFQERAGIDVSDLPEVAWMSAEDVVESSLVALLRGEIIHVPGRANKVAAALLGLAPRAALRRVAGAMMRPRVPSRASDSADRDRPADG
jgi:short-subunit dehydrogenase